MPVFISHRKDDSLIALSINKFLEKEGVRSYVDELDETLQTATNITQVIMERIQECSHMIAVVSLNTQGSWWVPFEIGVASRAERRISSYKINIVVLPEFLKIWPIMTNADHLKQFVYLYKNDKVVLSESYDYYERLKASSAYIQTAEDFHKKLKASTGQM